MKVGLIGYTEIDFRTMQNMTDGVWKAERHTEASDDLAEFAGRACYQSWDKPNPKTRANKDYLANVIALEHESVLSHASASFYCTGVSRSLTHELIRHRWLSFSELSQRYVSPESLGMVTPPVMDTPDDAMDLSLAFGDAKDFYDFFVMKLEKRGVTGKKAREAARAALPNCVETRIVVSGNLRAWRDFLKQRLSPQADAEIRLFAQEIHKNLLNIAPNSMIGVISE